MDLIFLDAYLQEKIWGGQKLKDIYHFQLPSDHTGEAWIISGHPHGPSRVHSPQAYAGMTLAELYQDQPELFGFGQPEDTNFPLLVKILDAKEDLSVQVHPDDSYAWTHEGELGKTECWYVIAADEGTEIVYGHCAKSREEFLQMAGEGQWDKLLKRLPIKAGDFFPVPAGTIHAIGGGALILETQQSSDTTYRVYDYDRKDKDGQKRQLHLDQAADVTHFPSQDTLAQAHTETQAGGQITELWANTHFTVYHWQVKEEIQVDTSNHPYSLVSLIQGQAQIEADGKTYDIVAGQSFIIPHAIHSVKVRGEASLICSHPNPKQN
ncbi:mannose-6-phosphate isomerase, class I [Aerococcus sanguinicola]|uniref:mannose-6-phosphate isomerase, class I n=1 Tax=Aerococcus sanguinicola TaxID=119206 RepID=UPI0018A70E86|nr:mannose-6-phosphate isomerase, class I [Aerococcus sanguinicola]